MKILYKISDRMQLEVNAEGQKELFKELSSIQEIFGESKCGMCNKDNIKFSVRTVESNDYFEMRCTDCKAVLSYGQHKKGGTLFPKRKDDNNNYLKNNGWHVWTKDSKDS